MQQSDLVSATAFVTMVVELTKPFIETIVTPQARLHDAIIRAWAFAVAVSTVLLLTVAPPAGKTLFNTVVTALAAMGFYHMVKTQNAQSAASGRGDGASMPES